MGRVKSLDRLVEKSGVKPYLQKGGKILSQRKDKNGYLRVRLQKTNLPRKSRPVHRLVGEVFVLNSENKPQINHKNFNKQDNRAENLEWMTNKENVNHFYTLGDERIHRGRIHYKTIFSDKDVLEIRRMAMAKELPNTKIAIKYGVCAGTIDHIVTRKTWTHI